MLGLPSTKLVTYHATTGKVVLFVFFINILLKKQLPRWSYEVDVVRQRIWNLLGAIEVQRKINILKITTEKRRLATLSRKTQLTPLQVSHKYK